MIPSHDCSRVLKAAGKAYGRSCKVCKLGPCAIPPVGKSAEPPQKVVSLHSVAVPTNQPYIAMVDMLEDMLVLARSGEMRAIGVSYVTTQAGRLAIGDNFCSAPGARWALAAATMRLHSAMGRNISDDA